MRNELLKAIEKKGDLPPLPSIITRLREMIEDPDAGINDVVQVIQSDPILSGRLLQLANNVYWSGGAFEVTTLTRAMSRLGLKMALDIAYSVELPKLFSSNTIIDQNQFWRYSLALATASSVISRIYKGSRDQFSNAYLGGLMRNTGVLVFSHLVPTEYKLLLQEISDDEQERRQKEQEAFGITSTELGRRFVEKWWPVSPNVLAYLQDAPQKLQPKLEHVVCIGNAFIRAEGFSDGIGQAPEKGSVKDLQKNFRLSDEHCDQIRMEVAAAMRVIG